MLLPPPHRAPERVAVSVYIALLLSIPVAVLLVALLTR